MLFPSGFQYDGQNFNLTPAIVIEPVGQGDICIFAAWGSFRWSGEVHIGKIPYSLFRNVQNGCNYFAHKLVEWQHKKYEEMLERGEIKWPE